jgi:hypothetical protein
MGFAVLRVALDPLHSSMWQEYLPVILEHSRLPRPLARALSKNDRLTRLLRKLRLRWLRGVRGHSIYVVARSTGRG